MARIVLTTWGSLGDLHPFLALGLGLRARGFEVSFAVEETLGAAPRAEGFAVHPLASVPPAALSAIEARLFRGVSVPASLRLIFRDAYLPTLRAKVEDLRVALRGADLLVSSISQLAGPIAADAAGIPWASLSLSPALPSAHLAPLASLSRAPRFLRPVLNRLAWQAGSAAVRGVADEPINALRAELGLPRGRDWLTRGALSKKLAAVAVSPALASSPPDWPARARMTGFLFWDAPREWREPPELSAFLAAPGSVVAVSTGSMAPEVQDAFSAFFRTAVEAVRRAGARALVIGAAPGVLPSSLPPDVFALKYAPFSRVYPRCAAIVHHGGIGTLAQGLRAGVPALVVPWGADQEFNGTLLAAAGAGKLLSRRACTAARGTSALGALLRDDRFRARAQGIAAAIAREDGVEQLCRELAALLA